MKGIFCFGRTGSTAATKLCSAVLSSASAASNLLLISVCYLQTTLLRHSPHQLGTTDVSAVMLLPKWRTALIVKSCAHTQTRGDIDANMNQRLARAAQRLLCRTRKSSVASISWLITTSMVDILNA